MKRDTRRSTERDGLVLSNSWRARATLNAVCSATWDSRRVRGDGVKFRGDRDVRAAETSPTVLITLETGGTAAEIAFLRVVCDEICAVTIFSVGEFASARGLVLDSPDDIH